MKLKPNPTVLRSLLVACALFGLAGLGFGHNLGDSLKTVVKTRYGGKVKIIKSYNTTTNKLVSKEKFKNGKRIYFIEFNEKGKILRHINKKGEEKVHTPGCKC
ncbi:MAG: hypothetical protein LC109_00715 [Bacteroidia bacterium]|jgi:hypothetical protein|nr:hypothetical protein [Bacteroidia bacterium]MCO5253161.1 hypothetical protein [Bacteroidota bacterium]MCZ2128772.1 hypothetical protein [Bacteroidia bacterium]